MSCRTASAVCNFTTFVITALSVMSMGLDIPYSGNVGNHSRRCGSHHLLSGGQIEVLAYTTISAGELLV